LPILNYSTKINPHQTVNEIQQMLAAHGAQAVTIEYAPMPPGRVAALLFSVAVAGHSVRYRMPCRPEGVLRVLKRQREILRTAKTQLSICQQAAEKVPKELVDFAKP